MSEPLDHVRRPDLPWRDGQRTECGRPAADFVSVISRDELMRRIKTDGMRRTAFTVCMTCMETSERWKTWVEDPVDVLSREFYSGRRDERLRDELLAIAALIEANREQFDEFMAGRAATVKLDEIRLARLRAARRR